jgi:hypothetical protein
VGLALETGMHISKTLLITWPQVHLQDRAIHLNKSKKAI